MPENQKYARAFDVFEAMAQEIAKHKKVSAAIPMVYHHAAKIAVDYEPGGNSTITADLGPKEDTLTIEQRKNIYQNAARRYENENLWISDTDLVALTDTGAWVQAYIWIPRQARPEEAITLKPVENAGSPGSKQND